MQLKVEPVESVQKFHDNIHSLLEHNAVRMAQAATHSSCSACPAS